MWRELLKELLTYHRGKFLGAITGLLFGILVITVGFLQTVFVVICLYVGYVIGKRVDDNESLREVVDHLLKRDN